MAGPKNSILSRIRGQILAVDDAYGKLFHIPVRGALDSDAKKALEKRHDECSRTLRNSILTFGGFAIICWAALSKPDIDLLAAQSTVKLGVVGIDVTLDNFLAVAPAAALLLLIHGAVFRFRLLALDPQVKSESRFSALFNLPGPLAKTATLFLHVLVPLALIAFLFIKTIHREGFQWNLLVFAVALFAIAATYLRAGWFHWSVRMAVLTVTVAATGTLFAGAFHPPVAKLLRDTSLRVLPLDYRGADFTDEKHKGLFLKAATIPFARFDGANLSGIDLKSADLRNTNLKGAIFRGSSLKGAKLGMADLEGAELKGADLGGANLTNANLTGAIFWKAELGSADFTNSNLTGANFRGARSIPDLSKACADPEDPPKFSKDKEQSVRDTCPETTRK